MTSEEIFIEEISLCEQYDERPRELVCRTCTRTSNKFWAHEKSVIIQARQSPDFKEEDFACSPNKVWDEVKVLNTTEHNNRIVAMGEESRHTTRAFLATCGHDVRRQCLACDHFVPIEVDVASPSSTDASIVYRPVKKGDKLVLEPFSSDGSRVNKWNVAVGGSCSLPVEGVKVNGSTVYCDFKPKGKRVESPSCANCYYIDYAGENWQFNYLEINDNASLTPYEKEQVLVQAEIEGTEPGLALGLALWKKQTTGHGRVLSFPVQILRKDYHNGDLKYKVRFLVNNIVAVVSAYDHRFFVNDDVEIGYDYRNSESSGTRYGVAEIMYPFHQHFSLPDNLKVVKRRWPNLPEKIVVENDCWSDLAKDTCPRCDTKRNKPCYYHSKAPKYNVAKGIVEFTTGRQRKYELVVPPHGTMHVEFRFGEYVAVDGNGNLPEAYGEDRANASVFRLYLPELLRKAKVMYGKKAVKDITKQYHKVTSLLHYTKPIKVRPSWLRTSGIEPSKPRCSNPNGLDLRKVFMDSFGSERTDIDFDLGAYNTAVVEEEIRVGKRQHSQTVQRLHEEILATITSHPKYRETIGGIVTSEVEWPENMTVHKLEAVGGMFDEAGNPITSTTEFLHRLDDEVQIGNSGDARRMITVRQQLYGYQLARGYYGKRKGSDKTQLPSFDTDVVIFEDRGEPDQIDVHDAWRCTHCNRTYDQSQIENWFSPTCECGHSLYKNHTSRVSYNARATGGIGNALAMDSDSTRQKQMLYATLCPKWRLNTNAATITLDDLSGNSKHVHETPVAISTQSGPVVHKIGGFLSPEHIAANEEYESKRQHVYAQRESYKEQYPETTISELEKKFPLPYGIVYVEKAAGSLAKMGGV